MQRWAVRASFLFWIGVTWSTQWSGCAHAPAPAAAPAQPAPAAAPAQPAPAAAPAQPGSAGIFRDKDYSSPCWSEISSNVRGAAVYIDDRSSGEVGKTPFVGHLSRGRHTIWVEKDGYVPQTRVVEVGSAECLVRFDLAPAPAK